MSTICPFRISPAADEKLSRNEAFRAVRDNLRRQELGLEAPCFCSSHRYSCSTEEQESFRLHRDIIHTFLLPLFLLHNQASRVAASILPAHKGAEPERAFRGEARSAYAWLHCIFTEEHDWYLTERCPACIVLHVLHSEPTIRFVAVACLLSDHLLNPGLLNSSRPLPSFNFWLEALETAVREDPFWGPDCWPEIEYRANALTDGVKQLVLQCLEFQTALDRQNMQSFTSYKANFRFQRDAQQSRPSHQIGLNTSCSQLPLKNTDDAKQHSKLAANRRLQAWTDRPRRFHTRREGDIRSRRRPLILTMASPTSLKQFHSTPSPFEEQIGYYRAVRHGQHIFVSGTTAVDPASPSHAPQILFPGDARQQTRVALEECIKAVQALGGKGAQNVVRVRMFVGRHEDCTAVGKGFTEILGRQSQPGVVGAAATMIVVRGGFIDERMLVEIEVDAIVD
ncbi:Endoribonuclease L-PSP/chorismate mutase-like protein [Aspergillus egyptiacus]|nr:Endoribonuclease L-PSP/chorismate mutase-like protein [Aspergillus egyptiacus]